jgi:hypothetical protein
VPSGYSVSPKYQSLINQYQEIGDMCNFDYGTLYGPTGAEWSQTINGDHYIMQRQWDSTANGCTQVPTPNLT